MWDYAVLVQQAKQKGGPEKLVEFIVNDSIKLGRKQMIPWIIVAAGAPIGIAFVAKKLIQYFREQDAISRRNFEIAKNELIRRLKEDETMQSKIIDVYQNNIEREGE